MPQSLLPELHMQKEKLLQSEFRQCFSFEHLGKELRLFFFFFEKEIAKFSHFEVNEKPDQSEILENQSKLLLLSLNRELEKANENLSSF